MHPRTLLLTLGAGLLATGTALSIALEDRARRGHDPAAAVSPDHAALTGPAAPDLPAAEPSAQDPARDPGPGVRLRLAGHMEGRLEPCGCASGQMGGLARRSFRIKQDRGFDLLVEGGNVVAGGTPLDVAKLMTALIVLDMRDYAAVAIGPDDLAVELDELMALHEGFRMVPLSADLQHPEGFEPWPVQPFAEHAVRGETLRLVALTLRLPDDPDPRLALRDPQAAWQAATATADADTLLVLLAHDGPERVRELARLRPRPDLVVGIDQAIPEPPARPETAGGVPVVFPGTRGRVLLDVTIDRDGAGAPTLLDYRVHHLRGSDTVRDAMRDPEVDALLDQHRHEVAEADLLQAMANRLPPPHDGDYLGSQACAGCHPTAFAAWQETKHAHAWATLEKAERDPDRYGWPVTEYPDCVGCHTVGYGRVGGFVDPQATPHLRDVGCEECHGPAGRHVATLGDGEQRFRMPPVGVEVCTRCHDFEQSPDFDYTRRWAQIEHGKEPR